MKHIELFEKWSSNFNRTLQGAFIKAKETNKGFGKVAKDIMDYAGRNITNEEFEAEGPRTTKFKFSFDPKTIVSPISSIGLALNYLAIPIIIKGSGSGSDLHTRFIIRYSEWNRETFLEINTPNWDDLTVRFTDRKSIENFTSMLVQAVLSDPGKPGKDSNINEVNLNKIISAHAILSKLTPEEFEELPGDTKAKKVILYFIDEMIIKGDMRRLMM